MNLLIAARRFATTTRDAVRSVVTPSALVLRDQQQQDQAPATVADPVDVFTEDELPAVELIEAAAAEYAAAADQARAADRVKRAAKKTIGRVPAGLYGGWLISRKTSSRMTVDLEAVRATYARLGLGELPMKSSAPSLVVTRAAVLAEVTS